MLTGRPPFSAPTPQQVMQKHVTSNLVPPDHINSKLSAGVSEVVEVMLSKRPQDRYNTTEDLLVDLRSVAAGEPPPEPASPFTVNQLTIILLVALAVAILINILQIVMQ